MNMITEIIVLGAKMAPKIAPGGFWEASGAL